MGTRDKASSAQTCAHKHSDGGNGHVVLRVDLKGPDQGPITTHNLWDGGTASNGGKKAVARGLCTRPYHNSLNGEAYQNTAR